MTSPISNNTANAPLPAHQRLWAVMHDPANQQLSIIDLCRKAGYRTTTMWYLALNHSAFRTAAERLHRLPRVAPQRNHPECGFFPRIAARRIWYVLQDPTQRTLPRRVICERAGYSEAIWYELMRDSAFRAAVQELGVPVADQADPDAEAFGGFRTLAQQRFWTLLQDPANRTLPRLELARKAGYRSDGCWYHAVQDPRFRAWVRSLGIPCARVPHRAHKLPTGPVPLATDPDAVWAQDRIDVRQLTTEYPKHKRATDFLLDFSFIQHPALRALIKRYFRARLGSKWSGYTLVTVLPTLKPIVQDLERRYPGMASFAHLTRERFEPLLSLTGWVDGAERYHPMTSERRLRTLILVNAMFHYMQQHRWPEAPPETVIYDEDYPQRIRRKPRPFPEMVMEQLMQHLERLPPYDRHLVQIMRVMGLRSVDAIHLHEDCLEYDATGDPRVRWYNMKMKRAVRPLPVTVEVADAIGAQRELVQTIPDVHGERYLFRVADGLYRYDLFLAHLNHLAQEVPILGPDGQVFHFRPHRFRHTVGTEMINNGMGIADVMTYLDHDSAEMTRNYAEIHDDTLKQKFKALVMSSQVVGGLALTALQEQIAQGDERELDWVVSNLRKLSLPWGQCLHHAKAPKCPYGQNACFTKDNGPCHKLVTTPDHLPIMRTTLADLRQSHQIAEDKGWELYAGDLAAQIAGMEQVVQELELPLDQRSRQRGGHA